MYQANPAFAHGDPIEPIVPVKYDDWLIFPCSHGVQDSVVITVRDAWGSPTPAGSVTVKSSAVDATGKGRATGSAPQTLQAGSSTGEYLYSTADLHASPGIYK